MVKISDFQSEVAGSIPAGCSKRIYMKYSIVIPTYNHCDDLLRPCIEAILNYTTMTDVEIIVSANGCRDNTHQYLSELKKQFASLGFSNHLQVVWNDSALGYPGAVNAGLAVACGQYIVLINNDAFLLPQPRDSWIRQLQVPFDMHSDCGISCINLVPSECAGHDFAVFFLVMIARKVFDRIGFLNEEYGIGGGEDTEFCIEACRAGFTVRGCVELVWRDGEIMYSGNYPLYHRGEGTMHDINLVQNIDQVGIRNSLKLAKKYNPSWYFDNTKDITVDLTDLEQQDNYTYNEIVVQNCYRVMPHEIENSVVVDIGANIGIFSLYCQYLGAKQIYAIEANPRVYRNKLLDNTISFPNITIANFAVYRDFDQTIKITDDHALSRISDSGLDVKTVTLEKFLVDYRINDDDLVLKIDCGGSEFDILMTARAQVLERFKIIYMELHRNFHSDPSYRDPEIIRSRLSKLGFVRVHTLEMFGGGPNGEWVSLDLFMEKWIRS